MRRVIIESPYGAPEPEIVERNLRYLRACMLDSLRRGEAPYASHGLYTQPGVLDDSIPEERNHGIAAGLCWRMLADATVVYTDYGTSTSMAAGVNHAKLVSKMCRLESGNRVLHEIEYRTLGFPWGEIPEHAVQERTDAVLASAVYATHKWGGGASEGVDLGALRAQVTQLSSWISKQDSILNAAQEQGVSPLVAAAQQAQRESEDLADAVEAKCAALERQLREFAQRVRSSTKHGPWPGGAGPCPPDCVKCEAERLVGAR